MFAANELRSGMTVIIDKEIYSVLLYEHIKPGKGGAFVRLKLKNYFTGAVIDKTVNTDEKFLPAKIYRKPMEYLYQDGNYYHVMDPESYEQFEVNETQMERAKNYLKENMTVTVVFHEDKIIDVEPPVTVEIAISVTEPGFRGDTVSGSTKPATLDTGVVIQVPLFVEIGDVIKVDTRTGTYIERVGKK